MWAGVDKKFALIKFSPSLVNQISKIIKNNKIRLKFKKSLNKKKGVNLIFRGGAAREIFELEPLK